MIFRVFVESGKQRLDCACAVGLGLGPLVFTFWASTYASTKNECCRVHPGGLRQKVGGRACTPLFDFKNNTLVYLYFECLLPLRYGAFYLQPGGLVPRARGRIYVAFGEHPAAGGWGLKFVGWVVPVLCVVFVCGRVVVWLCGCVVVWLCVCVCSCVCVCVSLFS